MIRYYYNIPDLIDTQNLGRSTKMLESDHLVSLSYLFSEFEARMQTNHVP